MKKVLVLLTNHATLGEEGEKNGTYAPELTHAVHEFLEAGFSYDLASISGGVAPIYGEDVDDQVNSEILANDEFATKINNTLRISQVNFSDYDGVYYPGGFGLLYDLANDEAVAQKTANLYENGGVVGAVCHGPAGLLPVTLSNGKTLLEEITVTGFTREEEVDYGTINKIPFLLEDSLVRKAKRFEKVQPWAVNVIEQGRVVTGQNPASATGVGQSMVKMINS